MKGNRLRREEARFPGGRFSTCKGSVVGKSLACPREGRPAAGASEELELCRPGQEEQEGFILLAGAHS